MLLLASASPRRAQLLSQIGVSFSQLATDIVEQPKPDEFPSAYVQRLAKEKGQAALVLKPEATVLSADTLIVFKDEIIEKPCNRSQAFKMLKSLSGQTHEVISAVSLMNQTRHLLSTVHSQVSFKTLSDSLIERYLATGEYQGKAGSYAIQGFAASFVANIQGSYSNVVGLPLAETTEMLDAFAISYWQKESS